MLFKILPLTFLLLSTFSCYNAHFPERPVVAVELESSGMHRELIYTVQFDYPLAGSECEYILEQNLSEGIFINIDQLDDLQRLNKLEALYPKFVDVEKPAEKAEKFKVLLIGTPKIAATIKLPIHLRYFAPQKDKAFIEHDIELPTLYVHCPSAVVHLIDDDILLTPNKTYCLDHENLNFIPSTPLSTNNCQWHLINMDLQHKKGSLTVQVPVGNANAFKWVLYATIIISWMVSLWTAFHTHSVPQRINHKLQEQRILQNKMK